MPIIQLAYRIQPSVQTCFQMLLVALDSRGYGLSKNDNTLVTLNAVVKHVFISVIAGSITCFIGYVLVSPVFSCRGSIRPSIFLENRTNSVPGFA